VPHFEQSIVILQRIKAENELVMAYAGYGNNPLGDLEWRDPS